MSTLTLTIDTEDLPYLVAAVTALRGDMQDPKTIKAAMRFMDQVMKAGYKPSDAAHALRLRALERSALFNLEALKPDPLPETVVACRCGNCSQLYTPASSSGLPLCPLCERMGGALGLLRKCSSCETLVASEEAPGGECQACLRRDPHQPEALPSPAVMLPKRVFDEALVRYALATGWVVEPEDAGPDPVNRLVKPGDPSMRWAANWKVIKIGDKTFTYPHWLQRRLIELDEGQIQAEWWPSHWCSNCERFSPADFQCCQHPKKAAFEHGCGHRFIDGNCRYCGVRENLMEPQAGLCPGPLASEAPTPLPPTKGAEGLINCQVCRGVIPASQGPTCVFCLERGLGQ